MAEILGDNMANTLLNPVSTALSALSPSTSGPTTTDPAAKDLTKDLFLKLMVAQLKNQNPLSPVDGASFLSQLSQVSGVEQMVQMNQQLEAIHSILSTNSTNSKSPTPAGTT